MYQGIVTTITTAPIEGADRIKKGFCHGATVVVSIDTKDGDLGIFFPTDGQLSDRMLDENKLRKEQGGYFEDNGRIKALKLLKGTVKSEGIWLPISSIDWVGPRVSLTDGDLIDTINGHEICTKYFTPATRATMAKNTPGKSKRGETKWFKKVGETPQLRYVLPTIPDGSLIYFTEKLHGTSGRFGFILDSVPNSWWRRLFGLQEKQVWRKLVGSKNVILTHKPDGGYYKDESFRYSVLNLPIHRGETLYYEIVGSLPNGQIIMPTVTVKDPELKKKYGPQMQYQYGTYPGQHKEFVYRITRTNEDGVVTELSWPQVKGRCKELGVEHVPEIFYGGYAEGILNVIGGEHDAQYDKLEALADRHLEGPSLLDPSHIREGICLRIEQPDGKIWFAKHKSFSFKVLEGIIKDDANYIDLEEIS